jgi:hypothetical protein
MIPKLAPMPPTHISSICPDCAKKAGGVWGEGATPVYFGRCHACRKDTFIFPTEMWSWVENA